MKFLRIFGIFFVLIFCVYLTPASVYAADLYFDGVYSSNWSDVENWFTDVSHLDPALSPPISTDDAYIDGYLETLPGTVTVNNLYVGNNNIVGINVIESIEVTNNLVVSNGSYIYMNGASITVTGGTASFYGSSNIENAQASGSFYFYHTSSCATSITGNAFFYNSAAMNTCQVSGDATFFGNDSVFNSLDATVDGTKIRYYNSTASSTINFTTDGPWTVVADGVVVSLDSAVVDGSTTLSEINSGDFVYGPFTVSTTGYNTLGYTSATLVGTINGTNGTVPTVRGFEYGTTLSYGSTISESGSFVAENFTNSASSLTAGTTYHYRAFATNSGGTVYGSDMTFTTTAYSAPAVTTSAASSISVTSAVLNGNITDIGGTNATIRGFVYGTTTAYGATTTSSGSFGTGTFNSSVSDLAASTTYHYKAFATNSAGTTYGSDVTFNTASISAPVVSVVSVLDIDFDSVTLTGNVTSTGGINVIERGFVYGTTASYGATTTSSGSFAAASYSLNIPDLEPRTTYYFAAYTKNSNYTSYSASSTFITTVENAPILKKLSSISTSLGPFSNAVISTSTVVTVGYNCDCITVHDVSNKYTPTILASSSTNTDPGAVISSGNYAYVSTYGGKLETWDLSVPSSPNRLGTYSFSTGRIGGKMRIQDDYLYVSYSQNGHTSPGGFGIFDISNPATTTPVSLVNFSTSPSGSGDLLPVGNYLYVADYFGYTLRVYDITNKASPVLLQNITGITDSLDYKGSNQFEPWRLLKKGNALYLSDDNVIKIYDISSSTDMQYVSSISAGRDVEGINFRGNIMYYSSSGVNTAATYRRLELYDVSDPFDPFLIHVLYTGLTNYWLNMDDDGYIYINSTSDNKLNIYDPIDPPTLDTNSESSLSQTSVTLSSSISDDGNASTTDSGFYWGTTALYGNTASTTGLLDVGDIFSESLSGLTCATTYHYRAFATNYIGTATSSDSTFTTADCDVSESAPSTSSGGSSGSSASSRVRNLIAQGNIQLAQEVAQQYNITVPTIGTGVTNPVISKNTFTRNLTITYTGPDVKVLQQYLNAKGFTLALTGPGSPGNETSIFGSLTRSALARFQAANKISPAVGYFGPITRAFVSTHP